MQNMKSSFNNNPVKISFEALPENQSFARTVVSGYLSLLDPTVEELTEVKTAVSEAVSNCIIHGYQGKGHGLIEMELEMIASDKLKIKITDYGKGIEDVEKAMEPMFSTEADNEMSGMGFTVMESFSDKVQVTSEPEKGTVVVLIKNLDIYYGR